MAENITPNCARSLALLSDYHDGLLGEAEQEFVRAHLGECPPCMVVLQDVQLIITSAAVMREDQGISFPDERVIWQRLRITNSAQ